MGCVEPTSFRRFESIKKYIRDVISPDRESVNVLSIFSQRKDPDAFRFEKVDHILDWLVSEAPVLTQQLRRHDWVLMTKIHQVRFKSVVSVGHPIIKKIGQRT